MIAKQYRSRINPHRIPDGHCAFCSWNACVGMKGHPLEEALEPGSTNSVIVGKWLQKTFINHHRGYLASFNNDNDPDVRHFEQQLKTYLIQHAPGDAFLLAIDDGTHWIAAQHTGGDVVFIDAQSGIGFNTYEKQQGNKVGPVRDDTEIKVFKITEDVIQEYYDKIKPTLIKGWQGTSGQRSKMKKTLKRRLTQLQRKLKTWKKLKQTRRRRRG